jgi:TetR/AcrR family transcriptional regulator, tetracycline repressor protein
VSRDKRHDSPGPRPSRRGRPPKGSAQLSREAIATAAVGVIDREGVASISMRAVARQLNADAKSLYNHVDGKDGLLDAVAEHILAGMEIPPATGATDVDLRAIAKSFRAVALRHPEAATLVLTRQLASRAGLAPVEAVLSVLRSAGFSPEEAVHLMRSFVAMLVGTLLREVNANNTFGVSDTEGIALRQAALAQSGLPRVAEAAPHLARLDKEAEFEFTVDLAIDNVLGRLGVPLN